MDFLIFITAYFILLIIASLTMTGWYAITRGRIEYNPDGTTYRTGKLFKGWSFFWTQHKALLVNLRGKRLVDLYVKLKDDGAGVDGFDCADEEYLVFEDLSREKICYIQSKYNIILLQHLQADHYQVMVTDKIYIFPEWVRDPLSECPWCMASVYGSLIWWVSYFLGMYKIFVWSDYPAIAPQLLWVSFCIGCSGLNGFFKNKFKI